MHSWLRILKDLLSVRARTCRAAEVLGLVERSDGTYKLTEVGHNFVVADRSHANELVTIQLARIPAFHEILERVSVGAGQQMTRARISEILQKHDPRIHGSTVPRRTMTVLSWLRWVGQTTGILTVDATGTVRPAPRLLL